MSRDILKIAQPFKVVRTLPQEEFQTNAKGLSETQRTPTSLKNPHNLDAQSQMANHVSSLSSSFISRVRKMFF